MSQSTEHLNTSPEDNNGGFVTPTAEELHARVYGHRRPIHLPNEMFSEDTFGPITAAETASYADDTPALTLSVSDENLGKPQVDNPQLLSLDDIERANRPFSRRQPQKYFNRRPRLP